ESYSDYLNFLGDHSTWLKARKIEFNDSTLFDNWISGFINGEGSFSILAKGSFVFCIEHTDKGVLEFIRRRMQFGPKVNFRASRKEGTFPRRTYAARKGRKDTYMLYISSKKDLESLIKFFSNNQIIPLQSFSGIRSLKGQGYKKEQYE